MKRGTPATVNTDLTLANPAARATRSSSVHVCYSRRCIPTGLLKTKHSTHVVRASCRMGGTKNILAASTQQLKGAGEVVANVIRVKMFDHLVTEYYVKALRLSVVSKVHAVGEGPRQSVLRIPSAASFARHVSSHDVRPLAARAAARAPFPAPTS